MLKARKLIELIPKRYYFAVVDAPVDIKLPDTIIMTVDYSRFPQVNNYFGPPNISDIWKFSILINGYLVNSKKKLIQWSLYQNKAQFTNAVFLMGAYFLLFCKKKPDQVMEYIKKIDIDNSIIDFLDVTFEPISLNMKYIYEGLNAAIICGWFNVGTFNYKLYEQELSTECGHMTWIIPGKFLALSDPTSFVNDMTYFIKYFKENNVQAVVRLNEPKYDKTIFEKAGIMHFDYYFPDVTAPSLLILKNFLDICHCIKGAIAIHCRAGLGRTGTLIACYMMQKYSMSALQCIGWLRTCRPGSIMGPQQKFLIMMENHICKIKNNTCFEYSNAFVKNMQH